MFRQIFNQAVREVRFYRRLLIHKHTPKVAKWCVYGGLAYLASPIDIIPDFVPFLGQLDDILIVGGLLYLARRLTPAAVIAECYRLTDDALTESQNRSKRLP